MAQANVQISGGVGTILLDPKQFRTGSRGFFGTAKVQAGDGKRYQVQVQAVEIGSKPK